MESNIVSSGTEMYIKNFSESIRHTSTQKEEELKLEHLRIIRKFYLEPRGEK